jgi:hypothetical protein
MDAHRVSEIFMGATRDNIFNFTYDFEVPFWLTVVNCKASISNVKFKLKMQEYSTNRGEDSLSL